ncbi:hypothetical protein [Yinghuangia sp. YIM S09857]|uniref:hypothetical protein n=1 Tax=Yinghuangia sp. YIM S09857 TaxID=3436929 RepID=UPI003F539FFD
MGCGCVFALLAALSPRLALILVWLFTNLVDRAWAGILVPLLGVIFFPFATLMYVLAYRPATGVTGVGWALVAIGFVVDLSSSGALARSRRR